MFDGNQTRNRSWSASDLLEHLTDLQAERALASLEGIDAHAAYRADLDHELAATRDAYLGTAVTEIASLRAELFGPQLG